MIEARAEQCAVIKPVCVQLIECRSQAAVGPGTIAGRDHREGAAGHHDPLGYASAAQQHLKDGKEE